MSSHPRPHGDLVNQNVHHEESDINVRAIITFVVVLTAISLSIHASMYGLFRLLNTIEDKTQPVVSPLSAPPAQPSNFPAPSLQTTPWTDLIKLRADEHAYLHGYGWVDQSAGVARIPIDKAKALLLQKGLPVRPQAADAAEGTHLAATGESSGGRNLPAGQADMSSGSATAPSPGAAPPATPGVGTTTGPGGAPAAAPQAGQPTPAAPKKPGGGGA